MRNFLLVAMVLLCTFASVNGQSKKKQQVAEQPEDESYQVVNVTKEASICYDTLTKAYDLVCFINQGNTQKTINVKLGKTWEEIASSLHKVMENNGVKSLTVSKIIRYFIMERRMPAGNYTMTLDYCTPYSLKLNVNYLDYDFDKMPMTFALDNPKGAETFKDKVTFNGELTAGDKEAIRKMIEEEFITNDVETGYFIRVLDGPEPETVTTPEEPAKGKGKKAKAEKPGKEDKQKKEKKNKK